MKIEKYVDEQLLQWASYDNIRKFNSFVDGQKNVTRKIIYSMLKNGNKSTRVDLLGNEVITYSKYIHGSLDGSFVNMCQHFTGANNLPLFTADGFFGSRLEPIASATRYIKTKNQKYLEKIIRKEDSPILIQQTFEGFNIEPRFYVPIIPLILITGNNGVSSGFKQTIFPRNVKDIIKNIINYIDKKPYRPMLPYYKGYKGTVSHIKETGQFQFKGIIKRENTSTVEILEVPMLSRNYKDLVSSRNYLYGLKDKNKIVSFKSECDTKKDLYKYTIKFKRSILEKLKTDDQILEHLGLISLQSEVLIAFDENNKINKYDDIKDIFYDYCAVRIEFYNKRKDHIIKQMKYDIELLSWKKTFLEYISTGKLIITKKSKAKLEEDLENLDFPKFDNSFSYLLDMKIYNITTDKIEEIANKIKMMQNELKEYKNKNINDMWKEELQELVETINK